MPLADAVTATNDRSMQIRQQQGQSRRTNAQGSAESDVRRTGRPLRNGARVRNDPERLHVHANDAGMTLNGVQRSTFGSRKTGMSSSAETVKEVVPQGRRSRHCAQTKSTARRHHTLYDHLAVTPSRTSRSRVKEPKVAVIAFKENPSAASGGFNNDRCLPGDRARQEESRRPNTKTASNGTARNTNPPCSSGRAWSYRHISRPGHNSAGPSSRDATPKPGKQRLGPRKKSISTLKKKILLERAAWWAEQQRSEPQPLEDTRCADSARTAANHPRAPSPVPAEAWDVIIRNLIDHDDVEDGDDHAQAEQDVRDMASQFGDILRLKVPRAVSRDGDSMAPTIVTYVSRGDAERAQASFHGQLIAGSTLEAGIEQTLLSVEGEREGADMLRHTCPAGSDTDHSRNPRVETNPNARPLLAETGVAGAIIEHSDTDADEAMEWSVFVSNLVSEEDDLEDDDEYAEICANAAEILGACSLPLALRIPRGNAEGVGMAIATFASLQDAEACAASTDGRFIAGKELRARVHPSSATSSSRPDIACPSDVSVDTKSACHPLGASTLPVCLAAYEKSTGSAAPALSRSDLIADEDELAIPGRATSVEWRVVFEHLVEAEDPEDDDGYDEVCTNVAAMISEFGHVSDLHIPRAKAVGSEEGLSKFGQVFAVFASLESAQACAQGFNSRIVGGKVVNAKVQRFPVQSRSRSSSGGGNNIDSSAQEIALATGYGTEASGTKLRSTTPNVDEAITRSRGARGQADVVASMGPDNTSCPAVMYASRALLPRTSTSSCTVATACGSQPKRIPNKYKEAATLPKPPCALALTPREYATQSPDEQVDSLVYEILQLLFKYQERARLSEPLKAKSRRRMVMGLREVLRGVRARKVRMLIIAPNVEVMGGEGGLDEKVSEIIDAAREAGIPVVFALTRRKIGKALGKSIKVSIVGVYSFDGANEQQKQLTRRLDTIGSEVPRRPMDACGAVTQEANPSPIT